MKRITAIEFTNFKAFYSSGEENKISIPEGKSVLIYGENGSGKSSIYEGLKQFFNSSDNTIEVIPSRNINVPTTYSQINDDGSEIEIQSPVSVNITFTDQDGEVFNSFGVPESNTTESNFIRTANLINGFLSYRELLHTYLLENPKDRQEFRRKFAKLFIEVILANNINSATQTTNIKAWEYLFVPRAWYKAEQLERFVKGLQLDINKINLIVNQILFYFEPSLQIKLIVNDAYIDYLANEKGNRVGNYPIFEMELEVTLFDELIDDSDENHLTVLNEARLSAVAISIYLAAIVNTPQNDFEFKVLFLDDIFIGLDMGNRLPLLEILKNFKKPVIEQFVDEDNDGIIADRIQEIDGIKQTENESFFKNYQIFITTYDRFWFEVAKRELETKSEGRWQFLELYANRRDELDFDTPLIYNSLNYKQKADYHYKKHDYPSCANHLRKALEKRIKELLPANEHYGEYLDNETGVTEFKKLKTLNHFLEKFITYCEANGINASELADLKNLKDWYFNPFSHDNIGTPIFKRELDIAKALVEQIDKFEFSVLLEAGSKLYFNFDNGEGQTRNYKIELQENLRWIKSKEGNILTNPIIQCYQWTQNVDAPVTVAWTMNGGNQLRLISFFNNKWKHLLAQPDIANVPVERLWNEIHQVGNNQTLISLITK